ncbi:MAG: hypothetical protein OXP71_10055 [Candidatus Poribacteria bacterium]|nr:hypothetical protein [Candidatus Poribacteria bacterium]
MHTNLWESAGNALGRARAIKLKSFGGYLLVSTLIGTVHFTVTEDWHEPELREIVDAMNEHFRTSTVRTNLTPFPLHVILEVLLLAVVVTFFYGSF